MVIFNRLTVTYGSNHMSPQIKIAILGLTSAAIYRTSQHP